MKGPTERMNAGSFQLLVFWCCSSAIGNRLQHCRWWNRLPRLIANQRPLTSDYAGVWTGARPPLVFCLCLRLFFGFFQSSSGYHLIAARCQPSQEVSEHRATISHQFQSRSSVVSSQLHPRGRGEGGGVKKKNKCTAISVNWCRENIDTKKKKKKVSPIKDNERDGRSKSTLQSVGSVFFSSSCYWFSAASFLYYHFFPPFFFYSVAFFFSLSLSLSLSLSHSLFTFHVGRYVTVVPGTLISFKR